MTSPKVTTVEHTCLKKKNSTDLESLALMYIIYWYHQSKKDDFSEIQYKKMKGMPPCGNERALAVITAAT